MGVRPPSLRAIAAFEAAARHQNFTRAAEELNLTQSAVSHAIRGLEHRLGVQLFTRFGRVVNLTDDGRILFGRLRLSLNLISEAFDPAGARERCRLTVAFQPGFAERMVGGRLARFRARHPECQLDIRSGLGLAELHTGEVDMAVWLGAGGWPGLSAQLLAPEKLWVVAAKSRRGAANVPRIPEELAQRPLIHHPDLPWRTWLEGVGLPDLTPPVEATVNDIGLAISLARDGMGAALVPSLLVQQDVRSGPLARLFDVEVPADAYYALWAPACPKESLVRAFAAWLREELEQWPLPSGRERGPPLQVVR